MLGGQAAVVGAPVAACMNSGIGDSAAARRQGERPALGAVIGGGAAPTSMHPVIIVAKRKFMGQDLGLRKCPGRNRQRR